MILDFEKHRRFLAGFAALLLACQPCLAAYSGKPKKNNAAKAAVTFSMPGGVYATNLVVSLAPEEPNGIIRFTLDGSEPGSRSATYSAPIQITNSTLLRARVFSPEGFPSATAAQAYTLLDADLTNFTSNLPLLVIDSFGTNIAHEFKVEGALHSFYGPTEGVSLMRAGEFSGRCLINIRGRASLRYPKNSFTVKLIDGDGDPADASLLGFPADADWVLYAPYPDKTLMRDFLAYEMHRSMGHWAPGARFVEIFVNRAGQKLSREDYAGVYLLEERIKRGKKRVNMAKLKPEDESEPQVTGGYIFKKDHIDRGAGPAGGEMGGGYGGAGVTSSSTRAGYPTGPGGFPADPKGFQPASRVTRSSSSSSSSSRSSSRIITNHVGFAFTLSAEATAGTAFRDPFELSVRDEEGFKTTKTNQFYFVEPEPDEITSVQKFWLRNHLNDFEAALYGPDFTNAARGYRAFIDQDSFIDYHLISEVTKNVDAFRFSVFFHKDRGGKVTADPIWDWNLSFGNANGKQGWMPELWLWPQLDNKEYSWYRRLFEDPEFGQRYVDRWVQLRATVFSTKEILARVDALAKLLDGPQKRNFEKWPILGRAINPNYFVGSSYEEEIDFMKKFIQTRLDWIEKQFPPVPKLDRSTDNRGIVRLTASAGEIYYTLDGSDPRTEGGGISGKARTGREPFPLDAGARVFARVRDDNRWSGPLILNE